jgi:hypothetical protein
MTGGGAHFAWVSGVGFARAGGCSSNSASESVEPFEYESTNIGDRAAYGGCFGWSGDCPADSFDSVEPFECDRMGIVDGADGGGCLAWNGNCHADSSDSVEPFECNRMGVGYCPEILPGKTQTRSQILADDKVQQRQQSGRRDQTPIDHKEGQVAAHSLEECLQFNDCFRATAMARDVDRFKARRAQQSLNETGQCPAKEFVPITTHGQASEEQ